MPHDVIISYATVDKLTADAVCAKLEARGIRCWISPRDILPGTDYAQSIINAIDSAQLTVLILSSHANLSKHVMREAKRSMDKGIPIIPLRIEDVQPSTSLQYYIGAQHWLDALTPPIERHIQKLAETVLIFLGKPPSPVQRVSKPPSPVQRVSPKSAVRTPSPAAFRPSLYTIVLLALVALITISVIVAGYYGTLQGSPSISSEGDTGTNAKPSVTAVTPSATIATQDAAFLKRFVANFEKVLKNSSSWNVSAWRVVWINDTSVNITVAYKGEGIQTKTSADTFMLRLFDTIEGASKYVNDHNADLPWSNFTAMDSPFPVSYERIAGNVPSVYADYWKWKGAGTVTEPRTITELTQLDRLVVSSVIVWSSPDM